MVLIDQEKNFSNFGNLNLYYQVYWVFTQMNYAFGESQILEMSSQTFKTVIWWAKSLPYSIFYYSVVFLKVCRNGMHILDQRTQSISHNGLYTLLVLVLHTCTFVFWSSIKPEHFLLPYFPCGCTLPHLDFSVLLWCTEWENAHQKRVVILQIARNWGQTAWTACRNC